MKKKIFQSAFSLFFLFSPYIEGYECYDCCDEIHFEGTEEGEYQVTDDDFPPSLLLSPYSDLSKALNKQANTTAPAEVAAPMANLEGEPSAFVHQCVNVITGQFCQFHTDLVVHHGSAPLYFERSFAGNSARGGMLGAGWKSNHSSILRHAQLKSGQGFPSSLYRDDHGGGFFVFEYAGTPRTCDFNKGITNTGYGEISGQFNLRNMRYEGGVKNGGNRKRRYQWLPKSDTSTMRLESETFPNGNQYLYQYTRSDHKNYLQKIELRSPSNKLAGFLEFALYSEKDLKKELPFIIKTHDGRSVRYQFAVINEKRTLLRSVERSDGPKEEYYYHFCYRGEQPFELIKQKWLPDERLLHIDYYFSGDNPVLGTNVPLRDSLDPRINRVRKLSAPAAPDGSMVPIYQFIYDLSVVTDKKNPQLRDVKHGTCLVCNALGHKTRYAFNEDHRLVMIDKFHANGELYTQEGLVWGDNASKNNTCLLARYLITPSESVFVHAYQYDERGNVLIDTLCGNLSGQNKIPPAVNGEGQAARNKCERYEIYKSYSNDGFNLLLGEHDKLIGTTYVYAQGTNQLIAKYQSAHSKQLRRWFYEYNDDAALVKEIVDDGTSLNAGDLTDVTERKIIYYTQSKIYPVAYPLIIEEKCLDLATGKELLIHKVVNTYTQQAKISKQDHYDSEGKYAYSLYWEYNEMGNITKEVDALGRTTTRRYDANGNCIFEQGPNSDCHKVFTYDLMNRLIKEEEVHADGNNRVISHKFNAASHRVATRDANGNLTLFAYDAFGRVIHTSYPRVFDENGTVYRPEITTTYDAMSNVISETNPKGMETRMKYTIRGQLAEVMFPDGTTEQNIYNLNGTLKESKAKNNTITRYTYDPLKRPLTTEIFSSTGELIASSHIVYNGFHVIKEIDAQGISTDYTYYPNGKLKSKQRENHLTTYTYDSLGRLHTTSEFDAASPQTPVMVKTEEHDLLNRLIEEKIQDGLGHVITSTAYTYDAGGNICQTIRETQAGTAITRVTYDSHRVPVLAIDADGNKTVTTCRYDYRNELGQGLPYKEITDPLGNVTIHICDALGRPITETKKNAFGKIIQQQKKAYDLRGNLCKITDVVMIPGEADQEVTSIMTYDCCDRLSACYEAHGTPEQKQTKITYNAFGQKECLIKNDGTVLSHTYDALGRLASLQSSDHTIHYVYEYDLSGNPIQVTNLIDGSVTQRQYDNSGHLAVETLGNQLTMAYQYDALGRATEITLPNATKMRYGYESTLLKEISRIDASGEISYTHRYQTYDQTGNPLSIALIGKAGELTHEYDILGRIKTTTAAHWKECITDYDAVGNILESRLQDPSGDISSSYTYDDLYQLSSESGRITHNYSYDSHYNRRSKDGRLHRLNALHQLIDDGKFTYTYDQNGNLIKKESDDETFTYAYDALDRLTSFCKNNLKVSYRYDENNRRLSKTIFYQDNHDDWKERETIRYLYQGQNEIGSLNENGEIKELRILGIGKGAEIGAAVAMEINDEVYVPIHDHIGNVSCLLNAQTGAVAEHYRYSSFGEELLNHTLSPWRFASKRTDEESGLVYFGRRYYDAETGRWVTPDPIGREGGPNLYAYVLNRPLTHFDLYGLFGMMNRIGSMIDGLISFLGNTISKIAALPGKAISLIGQHAPIPYLKNVVEFGGWCLEGKNPEAYEWDKSQSKRITHQGYGSGDPHLRHIMYFGILVSEDECRQRLQDYSKANGGVTVDGIYNSTHGFFLDTLEVFCQKLGIPTHAQRTAEAKTQKIVEEMGEYRNGGTLKVYAHSQGAETVHNLSSGLKRMMSVEAFGPARILQNTDFKSARNYITRFDPVPLLDPIGLIKGLRSGNVYYLPSTGCPIMDHYYSNKPFSELQQRQANTFKSFYGGVL